jgi:hypothetical protein
VNAVPGADDAGELLAVDVHQLTGPGALVADDLAASRTLSQPRAAMPAKDRMHRRGGQPQRPAERMRADTELGTRPLSTARSTAAGVRLGERRGRDERSASPSPRRALPTHLEAVWREQPTTSAAAVIVTPAATSSTTRRR